MTAVTKGVPTSVASWVYLWHEAIGKLVGYDESWFVLEEELGGMHQRVLAKDLAALISHDFGARDASYGED